MSLAALLLSYEVDREYFDTLKSDRQAIQRNDELHAVYTTLSAALTGAQRGLSEHGTQRLRELLQGLVGSKLQLLVKKAALVYPTTIA